MNMRRMCKPTIEPRAGKFNSCPKMKKILYDHPIFPCHITNRLKSYITTKFKATVTLLLNIMRGVYLSFNLFDRY